MKDDSKSFSLTREEEDILDRIVDGREIKDRREALAALIRNAGQPLTDNGL